MIAALKRASRPWRRRLNAFLERDLAFTAELQEPTEFHGSEYGGFGILRNSLGPDAVVLSGGVGEDASFDLSLIAKYGCTVHAFDPTPKSVAWVLANVTDPRFVFDACAIGHRDETLRLYLPKNPAFVSASVKAGRHTSRDTIDVPARRLSTIIRTLGADHVDLLKLDIEGAEYAVLAEYLDDGTVALPRQIALEFHHFYPEFGLESTRAAVRRLRERGYRLAWVSPSHHEVLFVMH